LGITLNKSSAAPITLARPGEFGDGKKPNRQPEIGVRPRLGCAKLKCGDNPKPGEDPAPR
jgi:hypothetical protein